MQYGAIHQSANACADFLFTPAASRDCPGASFFPALIVTMFARPPAALSHEAMGAIKTMHLGNL
jgi:hypothetical protein